MLYIILCEINNDVFFFFNSLRCTMHIIEHKHYLYLCTVWASQKYHKSNSLDVAAIIYIFNSIEYYLLKLISIALVFFFLFQPTQSSLYMFPERD